MSQRRVQPNQSLRPYLAQSVFILRNVVFALFVARYFLKAFRQLRGRGILGSIEQLYRVVLQRTFKVLLSLPILKQRVQRETDQALQQLELGMKLSDKVEMLDSLPRTGWDEEKVKNELQRLKELPCHTHTTGKISGAVYQDTPGFTGLLSYAYSMFSLANPLHPDVFPGVRKMEADITAMVLAMYNAPPGAGATMSSGGTESIMLACKTYRDLGRAEHGITEPEMIVPMTAHAAFDKAAQYFKIKIHHVDVDPLTYKVDVRAMARFVTMNTVMLVGSAPNFPHGMIDDIPAIGRLGLRKNIPVHVDACLGSFLVPFLDRCGYPSEPFDFLVRGVTSISCDTHKYGFASKGTSVIMYRTEKLRRYQYYVQPDWPGGIYASPTFAGSRPGALSAACWAALVKQGESGYIASCHAIVGATKKIEAGIRMDFPELQVIGNPLVSVIAFKAAENASLNIYDVGDAMSKKGWSFSALQRPAALHLSCTALTVASVDTLLSELRQCVDYVVAGSDGKKSDSGMAAIYGTAARLPDPSVVVRVAQGFVDNLFKG